MNAEMFEAWLKIHRSMHKRGKWADPAIPAGADEYRLWQKKFEQWGMDFDTAVEISEHLYAEEGEIYPEKTLPAMRRIQKEMLEKAAKSAGKSVNGGPLDEPYCHDCKGTGQALRYPHSPTHKAYGKAALALACVCGAGRRWMAANPNLGITDLRTQPRLQRRPVPWAELEDGLDNQFRYRPSQWDAELGRPKPVDLDAFRRDIAARGLRNLADSVGDRLRELRREARSVPLPKGDPPHASPSEFVGPASPPPRSEPSLWPRHADIRSALDGPSREILDAQEPWRMREIFDGIEREGMPTDSDIATVRLRLLSLAAPAKPPAPEPDPDPDPVPAPAARPSPARRVPAALK